MSGHKPRNPLRICASPFKSSLLSIPPSPFSPRTPLSPTLAIRQRAQRPEEQFPSAYPVPAIEAPSNPLSWIWKCHQCHHSYRLGVTRRCLEDGHHFCSGSTAIKSWQEMSKSRKAQKHRACASEFDYYGWKAMGRWRRGGSNKSQGKQDCWNRCDYPSQCRWGKKFGVQTPVETVFPSIEVNSMPTLTASVNTIPRSIFKPEDCSEIKTSRQADKTTFWGALLASAERRKSAGERGASPLSAGTGENEAHEYFDKTPEEGDRDGDVAMNTIDPVLLDNPHGSPPAVSPDSSSAVDSLTALVSRRRYRRVKFRSKLYSMTDKIHAGQKPTVPRHVAMEKDDQVSLDDPDMLIEGFAPLHRVQSKGSGYQSCSV